MMKNKNNRIKGYIHKNAEILLKHIKIVLEVHKSILKVINKYIHFFFYYKGVSCYSVELSVCVAGVLLKNST
jgi:hypothetical protein